MSSFRQIDQRHVSSEVSFMEWSPTMDLIALATVHGEVILHRLSWQKVWSLPSPGTKEKEVKVTAFSWRPDGQVLAVAYDTGKIVLSDVENSESLHVLDIQSVITCLNWVGDKAFQNEEVKFYDDCSSLFLPKIYSFNKNFASTSKQVEENADCTKKLRTQDLLNMLVVGTEAGFINLYSFGMFPCGQVAIFKKCAAVGEHNKIVSVALSEDFSILTTVIESKNEEKFVYYFYSLNVSLLQNKKEEIRIIAVKYGQIASLLTYMSATIRAISEAWEDILLEMDIKLFNYAKEKKRVSEGTISDDFLELLMFGTPSDILEKFLLHDLTENGLKKFGHSIEMSYSNIQKLVLKKLQNVCMSLFYHLTDLKGMALWSERFNNLGVTPSDVDKALSSVGSFLMKATELQQVIDNSMKNFKAFFRWLYAVILRLSDEQVPAEITKATQQDLNFVSAFLKENFACEWDKDSKSTFKLERVGQYLKDEKLLFLSPLNENPWIKLLHENPSVKEDNLIFPYHPEKSLIQQHFDVHKSIETAFSGLWNIFQHNVSIKNKYILFIADSPAPLRVSHLPCLKNGYFTTIFTNEIKPCTYLHLIKESVKGQIIGAVSLSFGKIQISTSSIELGSLCCSRHNIIDYKFYNEDIVSLLLIEQHDAESDINSPILAQLPLKCLEDSMKSVIVGNDGIICSNVSVLDGAIFIDKSSCRRLENVKVTQLAVSGFRKVACVLFASRRQVRLFEVDAEDEDEDQDEPEHEDSAVKDYCDTTQPVIKHESLAVSKDDKENSF